MCINALTVRVTIFIGQIICTLYTEKLSPWSKGMELVHPRSQRSPVFSCAAGVNLMPGAFHLYGSISNSLTRLTISHSTSD